MLAAGAAAGELLPAARPDFPAEPDPDPDLPEDEEPEDEDPDDEDPEDEQSGEDGEDPFPAGLPESASDLAAAGSLSFFAPSPEPDEPLRLSVR